MATRKSESSLPTLLAQIATLQAQADALRKKERARVIEQSKVAIAHYGLTADELGLAKKTAKSSKAARAGTKKLGTSAAKKSQGKVAAAIKYRDEAGNTWVGRGKRPDWFRAALAAGKKPEELLAKS